LAEEVLRLVVYDDELRAALALLREAGLTGVGATTTPSRVEELNRQITALRQGAREGGIKLDQLPTLNRDARILLYNLPGLREASMYLFQARRGVRAAQLGREAAAVSDIAPELSKQLEITSLVGYAALIIFVTKMIYDIVQKEVARIEQSRVELETMIRRNLDITHREYIELSRTQIGFASWLDQLNASIEEKGLGDAALDFVVNRILSILPATRDFRMHFADQYAEREREKNQIYGTDVAP